MVEPFDYKLDQFLKRIQQEQSERFYLRYVGTYLDGELEYKDVWERSPGGVKYIRIFQDTGIQHIARYFVSVEDGTIYGAENWRRPCLKRSFGTLDTIDQFMWGFDEGIAKPDSNFVMRTTRHHQTFVRRDI